MSPIDASINENINSPLPLGPSLLEQLSPQVKKGPDSFSSKKKYIANPNIVLKFDNKSSFKMKISNSGGQNEFSIGHDLEFPISNKGQPELVSGESLQKIMLTSRNDHQTVALKRKSTDNDEMKDEEKIDMSPPKRRNKLKRNLRDNDEMKEKEKIDIPPPKRQHKASI